jgi:hypothetical protein
MKVSGHVQDPAELPTSKVPGIHWPRFDSEFGPDKKYKISCYCLELDSCHVLAGIKTPNIAVENY